MPVRRGILAFLLSVKCYRKTLFYVMAGAIEQVVRCSLHPGKRDYARRGRATAAPTARSHP